MTPDEIRQEILKELCDACGASCKSPEDGCPWVVATVNLLDTLTAAIVDSCPHCVDCDVNYDFIKEFHEWENQIKKGE